MTELPIDASLPRIIEALARRSLVVVAPPGSGKTTRVPPAILRAGLLSADHPAVIVLQPRRVAARAAAARIAEEQGWSLGGEVGYQVRFERRFSPQTRLRFLTEGILTRQLLADPFLETVGAVILDEFHERNLNSDLALALLARGPARGAARLDPGRHVGHARRRGRSRGSWTVARSCGSTGRAHEVSLEYRPVGPAGQCRGDGPAHRGAAVGSARWRSYPGLSAGSGRDRRVWKRLEPAAGRAGALVLPLHGSLPPEDQDRALRPSDRRKVILSTNVAETSLTIDGVTTVIDSGLARIVRYDARAGHRPLGAGPDQSRRGRPASGSSGPDGARAAASASGPSATSAAARNSSSPRSTASTSAATVLALHAWGVADPARFGWYDPPSAGSPGRRRTAARHAGWTGRRPAPDHAAGRRDARPASPSPAGPLAGRGKAEAAGARDGATIAALLSERDIRASGSSGGSRVELSQRDMLRAVCPTSSTASTCWPRPRRADLLRRCGLAASIPAAARQVALLRDELLGAIDVVSTRSSRARADPVDDEDMLKWLLLAYPDRVVKRRGAERTGVMVGGRGVRLGPESVVRDAELYLALDAREDRRAGLLEVQVSLASMVRLEWLEELFPDALRRERLTRYDESRRRVIGATRLWYHDLLASRGPSASVDPDEAGLVLAEASGPRRPACCEAIPRPPSGWRGWISSGRLCPN